MKPELFDLKAKRTDQATAEANMEPHDRLLLTLELINLSIAFSRENILRQHKDSFKWIELKKTHE